MSDLLLQPRDLELLETLTSYHLTTDMIARMMGEPGKPLARKSYFIDRRLPQLANERYLKREMILSNGKPQSLYSLTAKGQSLLSFSPTRKKRITGRKTPHDIRIFEVMVEFELSIRALANRFQLLAYLPDSTFLLPYTNQAGKETAMKPDSTLLLADQGKPFLFFLEVDRSTETVSPTRHSEISNFRQKIEVYSSFRKERFQDHPTIQEFESIYGSLDGRFRVLTVANSNLRAQNLCYLADHMGKVNQFLFTSFESLSRGNVLTSPCWKTPAMEDEVLFTDK